MKKILSVLGMASVMAACSHTASEAELKQREAEIAAAKQYVLDSLNAVAAEKEAEARLAEERRLERQRQSSKPAKTVVYHSYSAPATTSNSRDAHDRPGWSNKAKGAVIGGVVGAATGAAVSDKKAKGAVIGGVVGAAGGYGVGAVIDNKKKKNGQ